MRNIAALACAMSILASATVSAGEDDDTRWQALRTALFGEQVIHDAGRVLSLDVPYRAHAAAIVPITISAEIPQLPHRYIQTITLLIDKNPVPVAAVFRMSPKHGVATISTRIRVNEYSHVRAIAETNDGQLFMASQFVKASGGCSAPATKDPDAALARLGRMRLRQLGELVLHEPNRAQLLISHPNSTGMQMDQVTRHYIPAHFVRNIEVRYAGEPVFNLESSISLSEDPSIHFYYLPDKPGDISVEVTDTEDRTYSNHWPVIPKAGS